MVNYYNYKNLPVIIILSIIITLSIFIYYTIIQKNIENYDSINSSKIYDFKSQNSSCNNISFKLSENSLNNMTLISQGNKIENLNELYQIMKTKKSNLYIIKNRLLNEELLVDLYKIKENSKLDLQIVNTISCELINGTVSSEIESKNAILTQQPSAIEIKPISNELISIAPVPSQAPISKSQEEQRELSLQTEPAKELALQAEPAQPPVVVIEPEQPPVVAIEPAQPPIAAEIEQSPLAAEQPGQLAKIAPAQESVSIQTKENNGDTLYNGMFMEIKNPEKLFTVNSEVSCIIFANTINKESLTGWSFEIKYDINILNFISMDPRSGAIYNKYGTFRVSSVQPLTNGISRPNGSKYFKICTLKFKVIKYMDYTNGITIFNASVRSLVDSLKTDFMGFETNPAPFKHTDHRGINQNNAEIKLEQSQQKTPISEAGMSMVLPPFAFWSGASFSVEIRANTGGKKITGWHFEVEYDNSLLHLQEAEFTREFTRPTTAPLKGAAFASGTFGAISSRGYVTAANVYISKLTFQVRSTVDVDANASITGYIKSMLDGRGVDSFGFQGKLTPFKHQDSRGSNQSTGKVLIERTAPAPAPATAHSSISKPGMQMILPTWPVFRNDSFSVVIRTNTGGKTILGYNFEVLYDNSVLRLEKAEFTTSFNRALTYPPVIASASGIFRASTASGGTKSGTYVYIATLTFQIRSTAAEETTTSITGYVRSMLDSGGVDWSGFEAAYAASNPVPFTHKDSRAGNRSSGQVMINRRTPTEGFANIKPFNSIFSFFNDIYNFFSYNLFSYNLFSYKEGLNNNQIYNGNIIFL